ncbi:MAG: hypothetical protein ACYC2T_15445 [Bacillota bacterium]
MLDEQALYFCRLDRLHDKWEGVYAKAMLEYWAKYLPAEDGKVNILKQLLIEKIIPSHFVNCWFMSDYESDAMWRLYSHNNEGIAIKSTIGRIKNSFERTKERIWIGKADYIDYDQWQPPEGEVSKPFLWMEPFFWKRLSFIYERELRALADIGNQSADGFNVSVNLDELVDEIYVFPDSQDWFLGLVKTIYKKYGYNDKKVKRSSLGERPWD